MKQTFPMRSCEKTCSLEQLRLLECQTGPSLCHSHFSIQGYDFSKGSVVKCILCLQYHFCCFSIQLVLTISFHWGAFLWCPEAVFLQFTFSLLSSDTVSWQTAGFDCWIMMLSELRLYFARWLCHSPTEISLPQPDPVPTGFLTDLGPLCNLVSSVLSPLLCRWGDWLRLVK